MNQRIPLPLPVETRIINGYGVGTVSARELHSFLEIKQDFPTWIKNRISECDFIENQDYVSHHYKCKMVREIDGTPRIEYYITLNMAKELAMVENNEKGREFRKYFIEREKKLNPTTTTGGPQGPVVCLAWTNTFRGVLSYNG